MNSKFKYLMFFGFCMFILPYVSFAKCDNQRKSELIKIAKNVQFGYSYYLDEQSNPVFHANISNCTSDIVVEDEYGNFVDDNSINNIVYNSGKNVIFTIYSNDSNCYGEKLIKKSVSFPNYNPLSKMKECADYSNFKYCSLWLNYNVTEDEFYRELDNYKKGSIHSEQESSVEEGSKVPLLFGIAIGVAITVLVVFIIIRKRKHR